MIRSSAWHLCSHQSLSELKLANAELGEDGARLSKWEQQVDLIARAGGWDLPPCRVTVLRDAARSGAERLCGLSRDLALELECLSRDLEIWASHLADGTRNGQGAGALPPPPAVRMLSPLLSNPLRSLRDSLAVVTESLLPLRVDVAEVASTGLTDISLIRLRIARLEMEARVLDRNIGSEVEAIVRGFAGTGPRHVSRWLVRPPAPSGLSHPGSFRTRATQHDELRIDWPSQPTSGHLW